MARFKRITTLNTIIDNGFVPVFYNPDIEISKEIVRACYEGGSKVIEMTNRGDHAIEVFSALEKYIRDEIPDMILGAGSIMDAPTAAIYIAHGTNFIVGPVLDEESAILCNKRKIPYSPGCGSASEIHKAHSLGVEIVKLFPGAQVGGPSFVKSILGPCPWASIMPTGGVNITKESLSQWFGAGVSCVGIGSKLITKEAIAGKDYKKITSEVRKVIQMIKEIKESI